MNYKTIIKATLVIIWMLVIFIFSSQNGIESSKLSNNFTYKIIEITKGKDYPEEKKEELVERLSFIVRKGAHFFVYFILAILVFAFLIDFKLNNYKLIIFTILICMLYAITDEIHQGLISGRAARLFDVLIDTSGSICSTSIMYFIKRTKSK